MKKKKNTSSNNVVKFIVVFIPISIIIVATITSVFYQLLKNETIKDIEETLSVTSAQNAESNYLFLNSYIKNIELAALYWTDSNTDNAEQIDYYTKLANNSVYDKITIFLYSQDDIVFFENTIEKAELGQTLAELDLVNDSGITDIYIDENGNSVATVYAAIKNELDIFCGYVLAQVSSTHLSDYFTNSYFDFGGTTAIVDSNGQYLAFSSPRSKDLISRNLITDMSNTEFNDGYTYLEFLDDFYSNQTIFLDYTKNGLPEYAQLTPIGINTWYVVNIADEEFITAEINKSLRTTTYILIGIVLIIIPLLIAIVRNMLIRRHESTNFTKYFTRISTHLQQNIVEYNFKTKTFTDGINVSVDNAIYEQMIRDLYGSHSELIHPNDIPQCEEFITNLKSNEQMHNVVLRMRIKSSEYLWYRATAFSIFDKKRQPETAVFMLTNVDNQVNRTLTLKQEAETDNLTGLYNKLTSEDAISKILERSDSSSQMHALLFIDLDNFKAVNDVLGHATGDTAIKVAAMKILDSFRSDDIVGRIGGDEFIAFIANVKSEALITSKCNQLNQSLNMTFGSDDTQVEISASIGCGLYPKHGLDFSTLSKNADIALYKTKENGKNGFTIYK